MAVPDSASKLFGKGNVLSTSPGLDSTLSHSISTSSAVFGWDRLCGVLLHLWQARDANWLS